MLVAFVDCVKILFEVFFQIKYHGLFFDLIVCGEAVPSVLVGAVVLAPVTASIRSAPTVPGCCSSVLLPALLTELNVFIECHSVF